MISKSLVNAVNEQIKNEIDSAYLYLAMSAYCESVNLPGTAQWLRTQWQEELGHAMRLAGMLYDRGGRVLFQAIEKPPAEFKSAKDIFQKVLSHEQKVTSLIHQLYATALKESDYAAQVELQWFIKEQVEEEKTAGEILNQLQLIGDNGSLLLMLDRQLGARGK
jgi:ferritin